ncbi:MAG TPA: hypothetical protein VMF60_00950 [Acidimicrobiales bacterium]|nr:hypothetical protein [Acidimicrobiales bacterium]
MVLDIGPHAGALVVYAPARLNGTEIEIRARGEAWRGVHAAVRARHVRGHIVHAGLFDALAPGPYDLRPRRSVPGTSVVTVGVTAGTVTTARLDAVPE